MTSQRIPSGVSADAWADHLLHDRGAAAEPPCPVQRDGWQPTVVDGRLGGWVGGDFGCQFTLVLVAADHRGYVFDARPDPARFTDAIFSQRLLERLLATVQLQASSAS